VNMKKIKTVQHQIKNQLLLGSLPETHRKLRMIILSSFSGRGRF